MLTLHEAVKSGRLQEFITQERGRGVGTIALSKMDAGIAALILRQPESPAPRCGSSNTPDTTTHDDEVLSNTR
jgi:hypothetical protein